MRTRLWFPLLVALPAFISSAPLRADERALVVLFGPTSEASGRSAAHSVAAATRAWLETSGAAVELRRIGIAEGQELTKYMDLEQAFLDSARIGRQADLLSFLNALDKATYALAHHHGKRLLIAVLDSPQPAVLAAMKGGAEEFSNRLSQTADFCRSNGENVIVLDPAEPLSAESLPALKDLATASGGVLVRDGNTLEAQVLTVVPAEKTVTANAPSAPAPAIASAGLPVHARVIRTQPQRARNAVTDLGPMHGLLLLECPLSALEFQDDHGKFLVHARLTETVRNAEGKSVWQAKKEVSVHEPAKKRDARRAGNLYYLREVQLPGGQPYTYEASVEDLVAGKSGAATTEFRAAESLPGLDVSDAMFVRPLNDSSDKFEADQVLSYDGKALAPMLDPVFVADEAFELRLYFVIYPDILGAKPEMSMDILRGGQAVAHSRLAFTDQIRDTAQESSAMGSKGEQKHEFPYMTDLRDATFSAGLYEIKVTVRQGRNTITRTTPFRVVRAQTGP